MHFEAVSLWGTHKKATAPNIPSSPFSLMTESIFSSLQSNLHMLGNYPHKTDQSKVPVSLSRSPWDIQQILLFLWENQMLWNVQQTENQCNEWKERKKRKQREIEDILRDILQAGR